MTKHPATSRDDTPDAGPEARALALLLEENWEWRLREFPTLATAVGDMRYDHVWGDASLAAHERRGSDLKQFLKQTRAIPTGRLDPAARLNHELFLYETQIAVDGLRFHDELMPLSQMGGVHQDVADVLQISPRRSAADLENIEARLRAVGLLVDQTIEAMREGAARGLTPPRAILVPIPDQIGGQITDDPAASPIARLIAADLPEGIDLTTRTRHLAAITRAVGEVVTPAFRKLRTYLVDDYLPRCRQSLGLTALPDGEAWYAHAIRAMTSCDLAPKAIHDLGLSEVARIRGDMLAVLGETGFKGDLQALLHHLRTDRRFFFDDKEALLMSYRDICKRLDAALPRLFLTLPRLPYGVVPVPEYSEKVQTTAYYYPGSAEAGRAGYFYANTYDLGARPKWEMESLTAHEAVPGHHLQIALAQELDGVPAFRRHGHHTAFVEGWGLYAEALGGEMGLYKDPFSRFGRLTYEMWRAVRLVVDTGLHALGWSREQAITYFELQAGKAGHDIRVEVDRYLAWPGQALAYKLGELKITELRRRASAAQGDAFDLRAFHDAVLLAGALPLPVLERRVDDWIASVVDTATPRAV
jgi:uncharacterized protein (DUF885 family)